MFDIDSEFDIAEKAIERIIVIAQEGASHQDVVKIGGFWQELQYFKHQAKRIRQKFLKKGEA